MINVKTNNDDEIIVHIFGSTSDLAREYAALSMNISKKFPKVLDLAIEIIDSDGLEVSE